MPNKAKIQNSSSDPILLLVVVVVGCGGGKAVEPERIEDPNGNGTLTIDTGPFGFSFTDNDGNLVLTTEAGEDGASCLSFGVYDALKDYHFYHPCNTQEAPFGARWKTAGDVAAKEEIDGGWRFEIDVDSMVGGRAELEVKQEDDVGLRFSLSIAGRAAVGYMRLDLSAGGEEHFYGLGERFGHTDAKGETFAMFTDIGGGLSSGFNEVHVPVPFFISSSGYGIFFEDPNPSCFEMNVDDSGKVRITYSKPSVLVWHVITGSSLIEIASRYGRLTGPAALPPKWSFAPQQWRNELEDRAELMADALAMREHDIPGSLIWIDNPWQTAYNTFVFNEDQFPEPAQMLAELRDMGYKALAWSTPYLDDTNDSHVREGMWTDTHGLFEEASEKGHFVMDMHGNPLYMLWKSGFSGGRMDFTNEDAVRFWQDLIGQVTSMGIVGFKLDYGEEIVPGVLGGATDFNFSDGSTGQTMHKIYSVLYQKTYRDRCIEDTGESFIIGRSSTYGGQKHVEAIWPGDLDNDFLRHGVPDPDEDGKGAVGGLPSALCALQNLAVSGFPNFGSDTGGYRGGMPTKEVLIRWAEHTALTPIMQLGGAGDHHNPWIFEDYDEETLEIYQRYARLHTRLFPLFYTLAKRAADEGAAPVVPVGMFDPDDAEAHAWWDEYILGESLLVAPVYEEGATSRDVRFPTGLWVQWWSRDTYEGAATHEVEAPLAVLPLFIRRGAIIPMIKNDVDTFISTTNEDYVTLDERKDLLYAHIVPAGTGSLELFDGAAVTYEEDGANLSVEAASGDWFRNFVIEIDWANRLGASSSPPGSVIKDSTLFDIEEDYAVVYERDCEDCWAYDAGSGLIAVSMSGDGKVELSE